MITSTGAFARASVDQRPPNPEPMITTRCLPDPRSTGAGLAGPGAGVSTVMIHSSLSPSGLRRAAAHRVRETGQPVTVIPPLLSNIPSDSSIKPPFARLSPSGRAPAQPTSRVDVGNLRARSFHTVCTCCYLCRAHAANVYVGFRHQRENPEGRCGLNLVD